ncbi:30S ribosomal protein S19 [candidate division WWE3 bacterium]|nr:30S ribosomal protein S19 [candidate division WWE3 bacterium]
MSRSAKKGPFVDPKLLKKIEALEAAGQRKPIKTWARDSVIHPKMVSYTIMIHDGKNFKELYVTESMVGHKLGEFAPTRKFGGHSKKGMPKDGGAS